jgi:hypothetical protein
MTRQAIEYAPVEFRLNPARPKDGRIFLGIVFAFNRDDEPELGWRWRFDIPDAELAPLDPLSREVLDQRKPTLRSEIMAATKVANNASDLLACLAARNIWSFHIAQPKSVKVERFDGNETTVEEWVDSWTTQIFEDEGVDWLERPHLIKRVRKPEPLPA